MTKALIEAMAALNKKGAKELIDHKNFDVRGSRFFLPVTRFTDALALPDNKFKDEGEALTEFAKVIVEGSRAYHEAHQTGRQNLGFEVLSGEDKDGVEIIGLVVFTGRPLTQDEVFMSEQLSKLAEDDVSDFDTMLQKLKQIIDPKAFDAFRAILSKANITRQQWNASRKKDPNAPKHEKFTGHGGAGSGVIWHIPPEKLKQQRKGGA